MDTEELVKKEDAVKALESLKDKNHKGEFEDSYRNLIITWCIDKIKGM